MITVVGFNVFCIIRFLSQRCRLNRPVLLFGDKYGSGVLKKILFVESVARLPEQIRSDEGLAVRGLHEARDL